MRRVSPLLLVYLLACNDQSLSKFNNEPEATIIYPTDGASLLEGEALVATGRVSDPNSGPESLTARWLSGGEELCAATAPDNDGNTSCAVTAGLDLTEITLEGVDPEGATALDSIALAITATEAPTATITAPEDGTTLYAGETFGLEGLVADGEDAVDSLAVSWTSSLSGDLGAAAPDSSGRSSLYTSLTEGDHVVTLTATDSTGKTGTDDILLHVGPENSDPGCGITSPVAGEVLDAEATVVLTGFATDADQSPTTLSAAWSSSADGALGASTPSSEGDVSLSVGPLSSGPHSLVLTVTDELGLVCSASVEVLVDSPPTAEIASPIDGSLWNEGELLTFTGAVSDPDEDPDLLGVLWADDLDGTLSTDAASPAGLSTFDLAPSAGVHTTTLTVTDEWGLTDSVSVTYTVNGLPTAPALHIDPAPATTADLLTAVMDSPSADAEGDPITYTYVWDRNGTVMPAYTSTTVPDSATSRGDTWTVTVTPNDGYGDGAPGSASVMIDDTAPVMASVAISPSTATTNTLLSAVVSASDVDGDPLSYTYAWTVNGGAAGAASTLSGATAFDKGDVVIVTVTPYDGALYGASMSSAPLTIDNTAPTGPSVSITPSAPDEGVDPLVCTITTASTDADGDTIGYDITWTADGQPYPSAFSGTTGPDTTTWPDDTIPAADTLLAEVWTCTVTPYDSEGDGTPATASTSVVPASSACSGDTVYVAYLPGWSSTHTSSSLVWTYLEAHALDYGDCNISVTTIGSNFNLASLTAYDIIVLSDPSGGGRTYSAGEAAAIRAYLTGGNGGALATYLLKYSSSDNSGLADLFGVTASALTASPGTISTGGKVIDATHPLADYLPATFTLVSFTAEQGISGGWAAATLASGADFIIQGSGQSSVIAYEAGTWRSVWFTGMVDYASAGVDSRQSLYNAIMWSAGYQ